VSPNSHQANDFDVFKLHFLMDKGDFAFFGVTTLDYPTRVAHLMINEIQAQFMPTFSKQALALKSGESLGNDCVKV
jgi:hypothetical protein